MIISAFVFSTLYFLADYYNTSIILGKRGQSINTALENYACFEIRILPASVIKINCATYLINWFFGPLWKISLGFLSLTLQEKSTAFKCHSPCPYSVQVTLPIPTSWILNTRALHFNNMSFNMALDGHWKKMIKLNQEHTSTPVN